LKFAVLHKHGPAECPARNEQQLAEFKQMLSDETAAGLGVKVTQRFYDTNCTDKITGHLFGAPIHHTVFIVESEKKENVQNFVKKFPSEIVNVRTPSDQ
jgi:hypothetical protein